MAGYNGDNHNGQTRQVFPYCLQITGEQRAHDMTHHQYQSFWREVCEAYSTPRDERTERQIELSFLGLCWAIDNLEHEDWFQMLPLITIYKVSDTPFYWPVESDDHRSIAAGLLAAMSAKDVEEFLGVNQ